MKEEEWDSGLKWLDGVVTIAFLSAQCVDVPNKLPSVLCARPKRDYDVMCVYFGKLAPDTENRGTMWTRFLFASGISIIEFIAVAAHPSSITFYIVFSHRVRNLIPRDVLLLCGGIAVGMWRRILWLLRGFLLGILLSFSFCWCFGCCVSCDFYVRLFYNRIL